MGLYFLSKKWRLYIFLKEFPSNCSTSLSMLGALELFYYIWFCYDTLCYGGSLILDHDMNCLFLVSKIMFPANDFFIGNDRIY